MDDDDRPQDIEGTTSEPEQAQVATPGGDEGPARTTETDEGLAAHYDAPEGFKDALEADPVVGGSGAIAGRQRPEGEDPPGED